MEEIKNKVQEELNNGNWKLIVNTYDQEASISFKSDWLNMMEVEVLIDFTPHKEEHFNVCSFNGMTFKEDLSTVQIEDMEFTLKYSGTDHEIDLTQYTCEFTSIIAEYFTPSDL